MKTLMMGLLVTVILFGVGTVWGAKTIGANSSSKSEKTSELEQKLKSIIIPKINFENVTVETAVQQLHEQSKKLDPDGIGVNIILKTPDKDSKSRVSMALTRRSLYQTIDFICKVSGLKFRIEKDVVIISK
ncbi:MAG: hypothetical protein WCS27_09200 [Victivallaceae bacterium]